MTAGGQYPGESIHANKGLNGRTFVEEKGELKLEEYNEVNSDQYLKSRQNSSDLSKRASRPNSFVSLPNENSIPPGRSIGSSRNSWADLPTRLAYHLYFFRFIYSL